MTSEIQLRRPPADIRGEARTQTAARLLPEPVLDLVADLHRKFEPRRQQLLAARVERQRVWDAGAVPGYLEGMDEATGPWKIAPLPEDLLQRRVEITGPINDTKMVINMLSRGADGIRADAAMLDFEDSMKPSWTNVLSGLENLIGVADGTLAFERPATADRPAKRYSLDPSDMPLLMVRCRGLHLNETNITVDGEPVSAGLFDLVLSAWHSAAKLVELNKTPKFYVPKCEHHLEARWWNRLLNRLEANLGLPTGTMRTTFLIETLPAAFQTEEILFELKDRAAGLNVGRWDKIFSDIKVLKEHPDRVLADRASISLNRPWMRNYALELIRVCHKHGAFAMGGMAAFTPGKTPERRTEQMKKVIDDKNLEASLGHDGCWVSHPYFIEPALSAFVHTNQLGVIPEIDERPDLLPEGGGPRTLAGLRTNARVAIAYMRGWQHAIGCVSWDDLMEDLATFEISRAQTWQWLRHEIALEEGVKVTPELVIRVFDDELVAILEEASSLPSGHKSEFEAAHQEARQIFLETEFRPFLALSSDPAQ